MQLPTMKTPTHKCLELAAYAGRMLGKFPERPRLLECARRMAESRSQLKDAHAACQEFIELSLVSRVDAGFAAYLAHREIRALQQKAQLADGCRGGRIASIVFPAGSMSIIRLQGRSRIKAMRGVEVRLAGVCDIWPEAAEQTLSMRRQRENYESALEAREAAARAVQTARVHRDSVKRRFLDAYAQIAGLVRAEFPRNRIMQDLFFDEVRNRRRNRTPETPVAETLAPPASVDIAGDRAA